MIKVENISCYNTCPFVEKPNVDGFRPCVAEIVAEVKRPCDENIRRSIDPEIPVILQMRHTAKGIAVFRGLTIYARVANGKITRY